MRMLYIANARLPTERAHGWQIMKTCEAFASHDADVTLLVPDEYNHLPDDPFDYYGVNRAFDIVRMPSFRWYWWEKIGYITKTALFTARAFLYALRRDDDVLYTRDLFLGYLLSKSGRHVVYEDHEPPRSKQWLYARFLKTIPKKVVVPDNLAELYRAFGIAPESFIVAPNGVDEREFANVGRDDLLWRECGVPRGNSVALYVGHFYKWKGVYTLIESVEYMPESVSVVMIGATEENFDEITRFIEERGLSHRVFAKHFMPHREVIRYIQSADVLILPNTAAEERSAKYTTPIKLFEYLSSGAPVVASNLPSFRKYIADRETAFLFAPDDAKDLAEKVCFAAYNRELSGRVGKAGRRAAKEYTWEKRASKIIDFVTSRSELT